jgi:type II secretory pathway pseudopilin PulG
MNRHGERRWRDRGAEGLTIVVSILLALLADAAWGYRNDRADERQLLEALRAEFAEAAEEIANDIAARDQILVRTDRLLEARRGPEGPIVADSLPAIVRDLVNWRFYTPGHAVLEDALESGRLDLIRSRQVRESLMAYRQASDRLPVFESHERSFVTDELEPYLGSRIALDKIMLDERDQDALAGQAEHFSQLLSDDRFGSLLYVRRDRSAEAQIYSRGVERAIRTVREALTSGPS